MTKKPKEVKPTDEDANETAFRVMREATGEAPKTVPRGERLPKKDGESGSDTTESQEQ